MNLAAALAVATKHRSAVDRVIAECDDRGLGELILSLLRLFDYAAARLSSRLGCVAILSALHSFADRDDGDWPTECAARMALAFNMMNDNVEPDLRAHGAYLLQQQVQAANVADQVCEVIIAIVDVWRVLLPAVDVDLLERFAYELEG